MENWRERLTVAPLGVLFIEYLPLWTLFTYVPPGQHSGSLRGHIVGGVVPAVLMTCFKGWERRRTLTRFGVATTEEWRRTVIAFNRGLRTGDPGADPSVDRAVLALLENRRRQAPSKRGMAALLGAGAAISILIGIASHDRIVSIYLALCWICTGVYLWVAIMRHPTQAANAARMEQALRARSGGAHDHDEEENSPQDLPPARDVG